MSKLFLLDSGLTGYQASTRSNCAGLPRPFQFLIADLREGGRDLRDSYVFISTAFYGLSSGPDRTF